MSAQQPAVGVAHVVPEHAPRARIDRYIVDHLDVFPTRSWTRKAIKRGEVLLNGEVVETSRFVTPGDRIELTAERRRPKESYVRDIEVIVEDAHFAVVNKPAGLPTMTARYKTLEHALPDNLTPSTERNALSWPRPVHRLDVPTQGLVVVAKTASALVALSRQFEARGVTKRYRALVLNVPPPEGIIEQPIDSRSARTRFRLLHAGRSLRTGWVSRVDLWPETGRTHQLRIHMANIGYPVLGDDLHGQRAPVLEHHGLFLAAVELNLHHPDSGAPLHVEMPEPPKFQSFLTREARRWARYHPEAADD